MNEKRDTAGPGIEVDESIANAYRALARERTPGRLDEDVLRMARETSDSRLARSRRWTRPLAWAAMLALSVVLVLETAREPETDGTDFTQREPDILDQASRISASRSTENREPGMLREVDGGAGCPEEATREPADWLACIAALEKAGLDEAATEQRRRLLETFPDADRR